MKHQLTKQQEALIKSAEITVELIADIMRKEGYFYIERDPERDCVTLTEFKSGRRKQSHTISINILNLVDIKPKNQVVIDHYKEEYNTGFEFYLYLNGQEVYRVHFEHWEGSNYWIQGVSLSEFKAHDTIVAAML